MTKKETEELIRNISGFFPSWKPKVSPRELIDSWYDILRKYEYEPIKALFPPLSGLREEEKGVFAKVIHDSCLRKNNGLRIGKPQVLALALLLTSRHSSYF